MADIATKKILENDKIVVWEMTLEPGEATGVHIHTRSYMLYVIEGSKVDTAWMSSRENSRPRMAPIWATSRKGAIWSRRAINQSCKVAGIAGGGSVPVSS